MIEYYFAPEFAGYQRIWFLRNDGVSIEEHLNPFQANGSLRNNIGRFREILHRLEKLIKIGPPIMAIKTTMSQPRYGLTSSMTRSVIPLSGLRLKIFI